MASKWLFLKLGQPWEVAIPLASVRRVLHRADPDYEAWAPEAASLSAALGVPPPRSLPGVLVVVSDGSCWAAGDAALCGEDRRTYLSLPPWALEGDGAWCRGVLTEGEEWALVCDPASMVDHLG